MLRLLSSRLGSAGRRGAALSMRRPPLSTMPAVSGGVIGPAVPPLRGRGGTGNAAGSSLLRLALAPIEAPRVTSVDAPMLKYKPTSNGRRHRLIVNKKGLYRGRPHPSLTFRIPSHAGRNHTGQIVTRGRQAPHHRRLYRVIDFKRRRSDPAVVERFEYDPNRSAFIALIRYQSDGEVAYILAPDGLEEGKVLQCGEGAPFEVGNAMPMGTIPDGFDIHNVELQPGAGGKLVRAAGTTARLISKDDKYVLLKLTSGEIRKVLKRCYATIGSVSNFRHRQRVLGKAGASRWIGRRPKVRGVAMNAVDHPMGGGEGRGSGGRPSCSPWGWYTKGIRTRNTKQHSSKLIVRRRNHEKLGLSAKNNGSW